MQRHAREREFGGKKGGREMMGNMLRRGESSWLCMKFELAFFAGATILDQVSELLLVFGFCLLAPPEFVRTAPG